MDLDKALRKARKHMMKEEAERKTKKDKKIKEGNRYRTRREKIINSIHPALLEVWFGDDEEAIGRFADYLMDSEDRWDNLQESSLDSYQEDLEEAIAELMSKPVKSMEDICRRFKKRKKLIKKYEKRAAMRKFRNSKDYGISLLLDPKTYNKKYLDKSEYRKELKRLAKRAEAEMEEIKNLGYIDCSLEGYQRRRGRILDVEAILDMALKDAYAQKYAIEE